MLLTAHSFVRALKYKLLLAKIKREEERRVESHMEKML